MTPAGIQVKDEICGKSQVSLTMSKHKLQVQVPQSWLERPVNISHKKLLLFGMPLPKVPSTSTFIAYYSVQAYMCTVHQDIQVLVHVGLHVHNVQTLVSLLHEQKVVHLLL